MRQWGNSGYLHSVKWAKLCPEHYQIFYLIKDCFLLCLSVFSSFSPTKQFCDRNQRLNMAISWGHVEGSHDERKWRRCGPEESPADRDDILKSLATHDREASHCAPRLQTQALASHPGHRTGVHFSEQPCGHCGQKKFKPTLQWWLSLKCTESEQSGRTMDQHQLYSKISPWEAAWVCSRKRLQTYAVLPMTRSWGIHDRLCFLPPCISSASLRANCYREAERSWTRLCGKRAVWTDPWLEKQRHLVCSWSLPFC